MQGHFMNTEVDADTPYTLTQSLQYKEPSEVEARPRAGQKLYVNPTELTKCGARQDFA